MEENDKSSVIAGEVMTPYVIQLNLDSSFKDAVDILTENNISAVFIHDLDANDYYIISQTDIIHFLSKDGVFRENLAEVPVKEIMQGPIETLDISTPLDKIIRFMTEHKYKRVLISEEKKATGVISTRNIMKWNNTYFRPAKPQILLFMDNIASTFIAKHIFHENIDDDVEDELIDVYGGALSSISIITNEVIKKSGGMRHLLKENRSILFETYKGITGILICDYNSIELRHKLRQATHSFYNLYINIISPCHEKGCCVAETLDITPILPIFKD